MPDMRRSYLKPSRITSGTQTVIQGALDPITMATPNLGPTATSTGDCDTVTKQLWRKSRVLSPAEGTHVETLCDECEKINFRAIVKRCQQVDWDNVETDYRLENARGYPTKLRGVPILEIAAKSPQTCRLCLFLQPVEKLYRSGAESYTLHAFLTSNFYAAEQERDGLAEICHFEGAGRSTTSTGDSILFGAPHYPLHNSETQWLSDDYFSISMNSSSANDGNHPTALPFHREVGQYVDVELIQHWLATCTEKHPSCNLDLGREKHKIILEGLRLIDCHENGIVDAPAGATYFALSYVWGRREVFPFQHRPRTIRDAMSLVLKLGKRYLWVDKYCITQDTQTEEENQEKNRQLKAMGRIYGGALATIVAAEGDSEDYGLPGVTRARTTNQHTYRGKDFVLIRGYSDKPQHRFKGPGKDGPPHWPERGWTFQEGMLSKRLIFLFDTELYFECLTMTCREADRSVTRKSTNWGEPVAMDANERREMGRGGLRTEETSLKHFWACIANYSLRALTYDEDILVAFQGILDEFEKGVNGSDAIHNLLGIPLPARFSRDSGVHGSSSLLPNLGWQRNSAKELQDDTNRRAGRNGEVLLPSWTWAAWNQDISPPLIFQAGRTGFTPIAKVRPMGDKRTFLQIEAPYYEVVFPAPPEALEKMSGYNTYEPYRDPNDIDTYLSSEALDDIFQPSPVVEWNMAFLYSYERSGSLDPSDDGERVFAINLKWLDEARTQAERIGGADIKIDRVNLELRPFSSVPKRKFFLY